MKESIFQSEWTASWHELLPKAFYCKIPDPPYSPDIIRRPIYKPFDCFGEIRGRIIHMELKQHRKSTAIPFRIMRDSELDGLLKAHNNSGLHGYAFIIINIRYGKINRTFSISIVQWEILERISEKKSIPLDDFTNNPNCMEIQRKKLPSGRYGWDIINWLNRM